VTARAKLGVRGVRLELRKDCSTEIRLTNADGDATRIRDRVSGRLDFVRDGDIVHLTIRFANGVARITGVPEGRYSMRFFPNTKSGLLPTGMQEISLPGREPILVPVHHGARLSLTFALPFSGTVWRIRDGKASDPPDVASHTFWLAGEAQLVRAVLETGRLRIVAGSLDSRWFVADVMLSSGVESNAVMREVGSCTPGVKVLGPDGKPRAGLAVTLRTEADSASLGIPPDPDVYRRKPRDRIEARTDEWGDVVFSGIYPGSYVLVTSGGEQVVSMLTPGQSGIVLRTE